MVFDPEVRTQQRVTLHFQKYQGTGNDFVMVDDREERFPIGNKNLISFLCDRKMGIGADGLILIRNHASVDFKMIFFNPDGSESLCGNGSRCAMEFAKQLGIITEKTTFETTDGIHDGFFEWGTPHFHLHDVKAIRHEGHDYFINTGSPHFIRMVDEVSEVDVRTEGRKIRYSEAFAPAGTNVNFLQKDTTGIRVRTYERGVENETLSCGTGVTACAIAAHHLGYSSPVHVSTPGGQLQVSFHEQDGHYTSIYLAGPATFVYQGSIDLPVD